MNQPPAPLAAVVADALSRGYRVNEVGWRSGATRKARLPAPGTAIRSILDMALCPHGVSTAEVAARGKGYSMSKVVEVLRDDYGFDIRPIDRGRWRVVGRVTDDGYFDFIAAEHAGDRR